MKDKLYWEEIEGVKNLNAELMRSRSSIKFLIENFFGIKAVRYYKYLRARKRLIETAKEQKLRELKNGQMQECSKVAIIFLGCKDYIKYFPKFYGTLEGMFLPNTPKDFFVFTDMIDYPYLKGKNNVKTIKIKFVNNAFASLFRFKRLVSISETLKNYSHVFYIDADVYAHSFIYEKDFFCHDKSLFSVIHPSFLVKPAQFEFNPKSTAALTKEDDLSVYRQCGFWGGITSEVLNMCKEIDKNIIQDLKNKIIAVWLDESHLNKYMVKNAEKVYTYDSSYLYVGVWSVPEGYVRKLIHDKGDIVKSHPH